MNYSNFDNIKIIVDTLKAHGISELVISPGGTNLVLVKSVENDDFFNCYSVVDERSAAYYAIGVYLQKRSPVALICTSAQATRNYIPGLTEAFYKKVPILAITMEKHPRFTYQEYMQAPDQTSLPRDCVKKSFELPFISDVNDMYYSGRVANQAILELSKNGNGPIQIAVPWVDFPMKEIMPGTKIINRYRCTDVAHYKWDNKKILIVVGEHIPFEKSEIAEITDFCACTNTVVYTNHLSNFNNDFCVSGNLFLQTISKDEIEEIKPDIIISIGGQTGDYPFYLLFSKNTLSGIEHWRVCEDGEVVDTYDKLTRVYQGSISEFFRNGKNTGDNSHDYLKLWKEKIDSRSTDLVLPFSNPSIAQYLHTQMPKDSIIQFSILNSLRIWNFFELDNSIECYSNVGAFGIDGGMSTLIGQSVVTDKLCFMIIGDLAFFYDMNSLGIRDIKNNLRVLLINNNGGIEFKLHGEDREQRDRYIAAANHFKTAKGWAENCGFEYYSAKTMDEFITHSKKFLSESDKPILLEAFVSDKDESDAYNFILSANSDDVATKEKLSKGMKDSLKSILGKERYASIKKIIKG